MANVRFYKLEVLPSFIVAKHQGIFVHVTGTMGNKKWAEINNPSFNPEKIYMTPGKDGENVGRINLEQWLTERRIESIESGLWFGGENGWELLSNDINSIDATIAALDVDGYTQATISGSTLTISGIKEVDGKIVKDDTKKLEVAIDGTYNETDNKIATKSTVTTAIEALNSEGTIQAVTTASAEGNTVLTFKGVKEENGKILQGDGATTFTVGDAKLNIQIGSATIENVFSANAQSNGAIKLNENVFTKDENNIISVITKNNDVSSTNPLVTQNDINGLAGAMHYRGALTGAQSGNGSWPLTVAAGDVYIVTTGFTHSGESNPFEVGDLIVFNSASLTDYKVVQSNITLGTGVGQVAANVDALAANHMVIATLGGIKTIDITETQLTGEDNNKRTLSIGDGTADTTGDITLYHDVTITDALTVIGKPFTKTIKISSTNRSIEIAKNPNDTGVMVDLVWNTSIE